jgi:ElaB/YqjD/DUF883 family membrane-anchored ribosome-binding protein
MAETTADVRRDIELTRERMSDTILELEQKLDVGRIVRDHPWPAIGLAAAAGFLLSGSRADVKAAGVAASTVTATKGKASRIAPLLDDLVAKVLAGVNDALQQRADELVEELKSAIGEPGGGHQRQSAMGHHATAQAPHAPTHAEAHAEAHRRGIPHDHPDGPAYGAADGFSPAGRMPQPEMRGTEAWSAGAGRVD